MNLCRNNCELSLYNQGKTVSCVCRERILSFIRTSNISPNEPPTHTKSTLHGHLMDPRRGKAMLLFSASGCGAYYIDQVSCRIRYAPIFALQAVSIWFYIFVSGRKAYPTRSGVRPDRIPNRYEKYTKRIPNGPPRGKTI